MKTTLGQLKESIINYYVSAGFNKSYDRVSKLRFKHKENSIVPAVIYSYFENLELCRISVRRKVQTN